MSYFILSPYNGGFGGRASRIFLLLISNLTPYGQIKIIQPLRILNYSAAHWYILKNDSWYKVFQKFSSLLAGKKNSSRAGSEPCCWGRNSFNLFLNIRRFQISLPTQNKESENAHSGTSWPGTDLGPTSKGGLGKLTHPLRLFPLMWELNRVKDEQHLQQEQALASRTEGFLCIIMQRGYKQEPESLLPNGPESRLPNGPESRLPSGPVKPDPWSSWHQAVTLRGLLPKGQISHELSLDGRPGCSRRMGPSLEQVLREARLRNVTTIKSEWTHGPFTIKQHDNAHEQTGP